MHVQMEDRLASPRTVVDHDARPALGDPQLLGDLGGRHQQMPKQLRIRRSGIAQRRDLPLGDHQEVRRGLRCHIVERQAVLVFVKQLRGDLPTKDASEHVRRIVCQLVLL